MRKLSKKTAIFIGLCVVVVLIIYYLSTRTDSKNSASTPVPTVPSDVVKEVVPAPAIQASYTVFSLPIVFNLKDKWNIPPYAELYTINKKRLSDGQVTAIAKQFQFTDAPIIIDDAYLKTKLYLFSKDKQTLRIYPEIEKLAYSDYSLDRTKLLDKSKPTDMEKLVKDYLTPRYFTPLSISPDTYKKDLERSLYKSEEEEGIVSNNPNTNEIKFTLSAPNNHPIVGMSFHLGSLFGEANADNQITRIEIDSISDIGRVGMAKLYTQEDAQRAAPLSAVIQSIDGLYEGDIEPQTIKLITVTSVRLVYLKEQKSDQKYLQPILELRGIVTLGNNAVRGINLYLRATSTL
jgi:hypothetical protein